MSLVDKLDEIIEANSKRLLELKKIPLEDTKRIGRYEYEIEIEESLYIKLKEQEKINKKYNLEIAELYKKLNENLDNSNKLENPFIKKGE